LATALPPLVNPSGVVLESRGAAAARIDGAAVTGAGVDVAAPASVVSNLQFAGGRVGVVVRAAGVTLSKLNVSKTDVGVFVGEQASDVRIEQSTFESNRIGVQIAGSDGLITAQNNHFARHRDAGVWAASSDHARAAQLVLVDNRFREDVRGVVLVGLMAEIERNLFDEIAGDAIHAAAARVVVKGNTMRAGFGFGA